MVRSTSSTFRGGYRTWNSPGRSRRSPAFSVASHRSPGSSCSTSAGRVFPTASRKSSFPRSSSGWTICAPFWIRWIRGVRRCSACRRAATWRCCSRRPIPSADGAIGELDFAGVHSGAYENAKITRRALNAQRAAHPTSRTVERREEAVAGRVHLATAEGGEFPAYQRVMPFQQFDPRPVSNVGKVVGRSHDIGEKHRSKHPVDVAGRPVSGQEFLYFIQHRILVANPGNVGITLQFDEASARNALGNVTTFVDLDVAVVGSVHDQCRHADGREGCADVDLRVHPQQRDGRARARRAAKVGGQATNGSRRLYSAT